MQQLINRVVLVAGVVWLVIAVVIVMANNYIAQNTIPPEQAEAMLKMARQQASKADAAAEREPELEFSIGNAHPNAAPLMKDSFYWDPVDENAPFGNDEGADALARYRHWRKTHPQGATIDSVKETGQAFGMPFEKWMSLDASRPEMALPTPDGFTLLTIDQVIIATALAQFYYDGCIDNEVKALANKAISNELTPTMLLRWGPKEERKVRLDKIRAVIDVAPAR